MNENRKEIEKAEFMRRHTLTDKSVIIGKKTFHVTCVFPIGGETDAENTEEKIKVLLGEQKKCC